MRSHRVWLIVLCTAPVLATATGCVVDLEVHGDAGFDEEDEEFEEHEDTLQLAVGVTRYLSPTGVDAGACTASGAPCRTFAYVLPRLACGDTLLVAGTHASPYVPNGSPPTLSYTARTSNPIQICSSSNPITVRAQPGADPVIKGLVRLSAMTWWVWDNVDVQWHSGGYTAHMLKLNGGNSWTWKNSEIWGARSFANLLIAKSSSGQVPSNFRVEGNCIHDNLADQDPDPSNNRSHNIYVGEIAGSRGGVITRNIIYRAIAGQGIKLASGSGVGSPTGVTVSYNTIHDSSQQAILIGTDAADNLLDRNLLVKTGQPFAVRGYDLSPSGGSNTIQATGYWDDTTLVKYYPDNGYRFADRGGHRREDPRFGQTYGCSASHYVPANAAMGGHGRWAP